MKELIIDTSSNLLCVGLLYDGIPMLVIREGNNDNAAHLVDRIEHILKESELTIDDIDNIIVGVGPGSYTGTRVSIVVAKTLAYTKKINLKTISSLNLLTSGYTELVSPAMDARRGYYFSGSYNNGIEVIKDTYISKEELENKEGNIVVIDPDTIYIDLLKVSDNSTVVEDIHGLEPNYLRITEAEYNYDKKNGTR